MTDLRTSIDNAVKSLLSGASSATILVTPEHLQEPIMNSRRALSPKHAALVYAAMEPAGYPAHEIKVQPEWHAGIDDEFAVLVFRDHDRLDQPPVFLGVVVFKSEHDATVLSAFVR